MKISINNLDTLRERENRAEGASPRKEKAEAEKAHAIPTLDEWEYTLTVAALRHYLRYETTPLQSDTYRQAKRKRFNRLKITTAIHKIRQANNR